MEKLYMEDLGAIPDGHFDDSMIFRLALARLKEADGRTLAFGPEVWASGQIELFSSTGVKRGGAPRRPVWACT
jgi:hypothetical protein